MIISTNQTVKLRSGLYAVQFNMTSGTVATSISLEGIIPSSLATLTKSAEGYEPSIFLPECMLTFEFTGDAELAIQPIER